MAIHRVHSWIPALLLSLFMLPLASSATLLGSYGYTLGFGTGQPGPAVEDLRVCLGGGSGGCVPEQVTLFDGLVVGTADAGATFVANAAADAAFHDAAQVLTNGVDDFVDVMFLENGYVETLESYAFFGVHWAKRS